MINANQFYPVIALYFLLTMVTGCNSEQKKSTRIEKQPQNPDQSAPPNDPVLVRKDSEQIVQQFHDQTGIELPSDAKIDFSSVNRESDFIYKFILSTSSSSLENWLKKLSLQDHPFSEEKRYLLGTNVGAWQPQSENTLPTTAVKYDNGTTFLIGKSITKGGKVKLYLVYHDT